MTTTIDTSKKLITPPLVKNQISVTEIPKKLYEYFLAKKITEEIKIEHYTGIVGRWCELVTDSKNERQKVILCLIERTDGDAAEVKFCLHSWYPKDNLYFGDDHDFEIFAVPESRGWNCIDGESFEEVLSYQTKNSIQNRILANHPITEYIALALLEMKSLLQVKTFEIVQQKFVDNDLTPPR